MGWASATRWAYTRSCPGCVNKNRADFSALLFFIRDIFHDISNLTVENSAEHFDGVRADTFIPFQTGDLSRADIELLDQGILGNASLFHNIPEVIIGNHSYQPPFLLDMITEYGI